MCSRRRVASENEEWQLVWATDASLPRSRPVGTYLKKHKWQLYYERNEHRVNDFPIALCVLLESFYGAATDERDELRRASDDQIRGQKGWAEWKPGPNLGGPRGCRTMCYGGTIRCFTTPESPFSPDAQFVSSG